MKLHVLSDIHVEFEAFDAPATDADVVILAGDIHVGRNGLDWALQQFPDSSSQVSKIFNVLGGMG